MEWSGVEYVWCGARMDVQRNCRNQYIYNTLSLPRTQGMRLSGGGGGGRVGIGIGIGIGRDQ